VFPHMRGLSASLQSFVQMMSFSLITGFVAPALYHSALMIAIGMLVLFVAGVLMWWVALRSSPATAAVQTTDPSAATQS
jgi:DHA1 family bicyclomycin/chloramphenicol resistance-like MFS transporter